MVETAIDLIGKHPRAVLMQSQYNKNEVVEGRLTEMGYEIAEINGSPCPYPIEPVSPNEADYDTPDDYTDIRERYENALNRYTTELEKVNARLEAGEISLYVFFNRQNVYLAYMNNTTASDNVKSNGAHENTPQAEIAKLEAKDKRNKEIAVERTIEDVKKQILNADITESKFTQDEEKMIYYFLLSALRREHYEAVGLTERLNSFYGLTENEKLTIIANLNAKKKAIIRRDFLIENFKGACRDTAVADFLPAFSKKHMPEKLANIEAGYNEVYEKRHQRIAERIAVFNGMIEKESENPATPESTPDTEEEAPQTEADTPQTEETAA